MQIIVNGYFLLIVDGIAILWQVYKTYIIIVFNMYVLCNDIQRSLYIVDN
jgi:hypothetical protein